MRLTVVILTLNEEKHLARCLSSLNGIENSVLVNVIDDENQAVPFCVLTFSTKQFDQTGLTNEKGYARFQNLRQGLEFSIKINYPPYESLTKEFICDGRKEYCVQIKKEEIPYPLAKVKYSIK